MAEKKELKPAKPILKPYYTLEAAFDRLVSLGADLTEPSDLLLLAQNEKITILVLLANIVTFVSTSDTIAIMNLSSSEKEKIQKELLDQNYDEQIDIDAQASLAGAIHKKFIIYSRCHISGINEEPILIRPFKLNTVGNMIDENSKHLTYLNPKSFDVSLKEYQGFLYENKPYFVIHDMELVRDIFGLEINTKEKQNCMYGVLSGEEIHEAIINNQYVIADYEIARFEREVLGFDHKVIYTDKRPIPNIIAYNQQRQQNLTPDPNDVQAKYNELHAQNPKHSKAQLHQKLAKHFNTSVSTIKRRINTTKQNS